MKKKKIRGHKRRWKDIEAWIDSYKNHDIGYLTRFDRDYAKIRVHPWNRISLTDSQISEPKGETKKRILKGLIQIYDSWKNTLEQLGEPYYLKIWLFEPRFSSSQVVCAIGNSIDFYETTFFKPDYEKRLRLENYGDLKNDLEGFYWDYRLDEKHYSDSEVGTPDMYASQADYEDYKRWFSGLMKKPHRAIKFKEPIGEATESYSFKQGEVWLGQK